VPLPFISLKVGQGRAAKALVPGRAATDAGLERNAHACPNPNCQTKSLGRVISWITNSGPSLSLAGSFLNLSWRHEGFAEYSWMAFVKCA